MAFQRCGEITQGSGLEITACHFYFFFFFTRSEAPLLLPSAGKWCLQSGRLLVHQLAMVSPGAGPPKVLFATFVILFIYLYIYFLELLRLLRLGPRCQRGGGDPRGRGKGGCGVLLRGEPRGEENSLSPPLSPGPRERTTASPHPSIPGWRGLVFFGGDPWKWVLVEAGRAKWVTPKC